MWGLDPDETEEIVAVLLGGVFLIVFEATLIGYMIWFFKQ